MLTARCNAVAASLLVLACMPLSGHSQAGTRFHTDPACWSEPRIYHPGPPNEQQADQVHLIETPAAAPAPGEPVTAPNGAYRFWVRNPDTSRRGPWNAGLIVDVERESRPTLLFENVADPINPRWLNEKLIFLRVAWGRRVFSDLIFDVEARALIYHEQAIYGANAYHQFQQACGEQCPCTGQGPPQPDAQQSATTSPPPVRPATASAGLMPPAKPGPDALIGLLKLPTIFGAPEAGGVVATDHPTPVPVYAAPEAGAKKLGEPAEPHDFERKEYTYEGAAAVVYAKQPGWYQIGMANDTKAWLSAKSAGEYLPIGQLLKARLAYLNQHWNRKLWESPTTYKGWNSRLKKGKDAAEDVEISADILEYRTLGKHLWLRIETYDHSVCEGGARRIVDQGWIPAYSEDGKLVADYYARGC